MTPKNQQSNKPNKRKHAPAAKPDAPDRPTSKRPKLAAPKRSGPPTTTKRSDKPFKPKFQKSEPDTVKKAPLSKRERRINAKVNPSHFFFFFWVSVFSWIFFINQSLRKKNKEEVYFLVLLISVIVKQYVDVIWWMGIEFGLLKVDLFIYLFFLGSDFSGVIVYCRNWQRLGRRRGSHITSLSMWVLFTWLCLL